MGVIELQVRDDQLAVGGGETRERRAVASVRLRVDRLVERRPPAIRQRIRQRRRDAPARDPPVLVADTVPHGLPKVRGERMSRARVHGVAASERPQHRVVD